MLLWQTVAWLLCTRALCSIAEQPGHGERCYACLHASFSGWLWLQASFKLPTLHFKQQVLTRAGRSAVLLHPPTK